MVALRDALPCHEPNVRLLEPSPTITRCGARVTPNHPASDPDAVSRARAELGYLISEMSSCIQHKTSILNCKAR